MRLVFGFLSKKSKKHAEPVVKARPDHCISRKDIDPDALKVLYRLDKLGYKAYLVGGGVRDLLLGRKPKDFDVGTSATPNEVKRAFRNCFLIGRRFRLAHVRFGEKVIETATFRQNSQTVGEIIEHAAASLDSEDVKPLDDNTFGTPETDAYRRDFTVNGIFYDIHDFSVIDWVGGLEDLEKRVIRSIGDPMIRFREDPVRMMRAIKFASRLDFEIERGTGRAMKKLHSLIRTASVPRLCEEIFRLFPFGKSAVAFRLLWEYGLMVDILPELAAFIDRDGGKESSAWRYLEMLDRYETAMARNNYEVSNGLRVACLYAAMAKAEPGLKPEALLDGFRKALNPPKATIFSAERMMDSVRRLVNPPSQSKRRCLRHPEFPDWLDFNRIVVRAEGRDEKVLDAWEKLYKEQGERNE